MQIGGIHSPVFTNIRPQTTNFYCVPFFFIEFQNLSVISFRHTVLTKLSGIFCLKITSNQNRESEVFLNKYLLSNAIPWYIFAHVFLLMMRNYWWITMLKPLQKLKIRQNIVAASFVFILDTHYSPGNIFWTYDNVKWYDKNSKLYVIKTY